jgi:hypothetical protein
MRRLLADRFRVPGVPPLDVDNSPPPIEETLASLVERFCPAARPKILAQQPGVGSEPEMRPSPRLKLAK